MLTKNRYLNHFRNFLLFIINKSHMISMSIYAFQIYQNRFQNSIKTLIPLGIKQGNNKLMAIKI